MDGLWTKRFRPGVVVSLFFFMGKNWNEGVSHLGGERVNCWRFEEMVKKPVERALGSVAEKIVGRCVAGSRDKQDVHRKQ